MLATLTVRHTAQDSAELCRAVRKCWQAMLQGAGWKAYKRERGVELLAAEEVTHGANGWHPHIHVLLLPARAQDTDLYVADAAWWRDRWTRIVARKLGAQHVPSETHGTDLRPCKVGDYLSKLGIELADSSAVKGRAPLELLRQGERELYLELARVRHRARDVTWSRGLRALRDSLPKPEAGTCVLQPAAYEWERAREHGRLLEALEAAEAGGAAAARAAMWSSLPVGEQPQHDEKRNDPHGDETRDG
jgi:hypothetical protein